MIKLYFQKYSQLPNHIKSLESIYLFEEIGHQETLVKSNLYKQYKGHLYFNDRLHYLPLNSLYHPFFIDIEGFWNRISKQKILKTDLLNKALKDCSKADENNSIIIDACAGSLKDALFLLKSGFRVISFENNRVIFDLLTDAIINFKAKYNSLIFENHKLFYKDFEKFTEFKLDLNIESYSKIFCYLDPMFSHQRKALPKKDMVIFKEIIERALFHDRSNHLPKQSTILSSALKSNFDKIIVKRADKSIFLEGFTPKYQIKGKTVRFDIYR